MAHFVSCLPSIRASSSPRSRPTSTCESTYEPKRRTRRSCVLIILLLMLLLLLVHIIKGITIKVYNIKAPFFYYCNRRLLTSITCVPEPCKRWRSQQYRIGSTGRAWQSRISPLWLCSLIMTNRKRESVPASALDLISKGSRVLCAVDGVTGYFFSSSS